MSETTIKSFVQQSIDKYLEKRHNLCKEFEDTKILIDTGASCNHIQADKCEMVGTITSPL